MDTIILVIIAILAVLFVIGYFASAVILTWLSKLFKIENASLKKSLVVIFLSGFASFIAGVIFGIINLGIISNILVMIISFAVFHYLLKNYYQNNWKQSLGIYISFSVATIILSLLIVLPVRTFIIQPFFVDGDSMSPNYNKNDYLLIGMVDRQFNRGDVIVYRNPKDKNQFLIKRIVGLPGEKVDIQGGMVFINNQQLNESYYNGKTFNINPDSTSIILSEGQYFVLGDNRGKSFDSRMHGPIEKSYIIGKIIYNFTARK